MRRLPRHIAWIGLHGKNAKFDQIDSRLATSERSKRRFYSILQFRFWCHAHIYSPVFSLILGFVLGKKQDFALTLIFLSIGSLSFAFWDSWGGGYADKHGCKAAIRLGLRLMIAVMILFAFVSLVPEGFRHYALLLAFAAQLVVGLPLALIDAADSELTRKISHQVGLTDTEVVFAEGICSQLKYSGIAVASFIGCLIFIAVSKWFGAERTTETESDHHTSLAAFIVFMLTAGLQTYALFLLRRVKEPRVKRETHKNRQKISRLCLEALKSIRREQVLMTWVLIVAVTEGWLLFSTSYFQLDALSGFVGSNEKFWLIILTVPIAYGILSIVASKGGAVFNWWHAQAGASEADDHLKLRGGTRLAIPRRQLIGAGGILVAMLAGFIVHFLAPHLLGLIAPFTVPPFWQKSFSIRLAGYCLTVITLPLFAFYQFLRGFAHPLLKTTMGRIIEKNTISDSVTTLSIALAGGRFFHAISAMLFLGCFMWVRTSEGVAPDNRGRALAAMVVIISLAVVILNVFFGVLLDRTAVAPDDSPPFWRWSEIRSMLSRRSFRSITIKGAFFVFLAMSNIIAPKFLSIGWLEFNAGAMCYALTFMLVDSIAETEGRRASRKLWLAGMFSYFVVVISVAVALAPGGHNPELQLVFNDIFGKTKEVANLDVILAFKTILARGVLGFVIASLCSFSIAQYLDIWIFLLLKSAFRGQALWLRNNISTFLAQAVDTIIFIFVATLILKFHWSLLTQFHLLNWTAVFGLWSTLLSRVTGQLSIKWGFSLASTVLLYLAVRWIERGTISMRFDDSGKGETVFLLHDFPLNRSMWREQVTLLNSHGYRVITADLRGLGETRSETTVVRMEDIARDVAALMNELKIDRAILGGVSMGCFVAFEFIQLFPNRVKALVLCGPRSSEPDEAEKQSLEIQAQRALTDGVDFVADAVVKSVLAQGNLKEKSEVVTRVRKMVMGTNPQGAAAIQRGLARRRGYARDLGHIKVPTLIITGSEDAGGRREDAELIHAGIEGSQLVVINDAGHLMNIDHPEAFNKSLIDFLKNQCHKPTRG